MTRAALAILAACAPLMSMAQADTLERDVHDIALVVYHEARGESFEGQLAVAHVVINRARSGRFPSSIHEVVTQRKAFSALRGRPLVIADVAAWVGAKRGARIALQDPDSDPTGGATFFDGKDATPPWRPRMVLLAIIGAHAFYRERGT